jgi:hypothetical protein
MLPDSKQTSSIQNFLAFNSLNAMNSPIHFKKIAAVAGTVAAVALSSSCTLPPDQAWRKIRTDGLVAYWSYELDAQRAYAPLHRALPNVPLPPRHASPITPRLQLAQNGSERVSPLPPQSYLHDRIGAADIGTPLTAQSIPALPGFVRSPYTNPPRLVDVKGALPGSTMICPYTQRPFIVPSDFGSGSSSAVATVTPSKPAPTNIAPRTPSATTAPSGNIGTGPKTTIAGNKPAAPSPSPSVASAPEPPKNKPAAKPTTPNIGPAKSFSSGPTPPAVGSTSKAAQDIPFGTPIAGRPGFVNSPYAAKYQLVDVTGLPAGMEVKCPYTGKLFRVPPQDMVSTTPAETAPLASPEAPKKK